MSLRRDILIGIYEELSKIESIKFIDINKGQLDNPEKDYPIVLPAVLINVGNIIFEDLSDTQKEGHADDITVTVVHQELTDTFRGSNTTTSTLSYLNINDAIITALDGFKIDTKFLPISLLAENRVNSETSIAVFELTFRTLGQIDPQK